MHEDRYEYERDAIASGERLRRGEGRANMIGTGGALALGGAMALGSRKYLDGVKKKHLSDLNNPDAKPDLRRWVYKKDGTYDYVSPFGTKHALGATALAAGGGYLLARQLKKRWEREENRKMREKHASYDRDLLEEDMQRRMSGRRAPVGEIASRLASKRAPISSELTLRIGIPSAITALVPGEAKVPAGALATMVGNIIANRRDNEWRMRRLQQIDGISAMSDKELRGAHKRAIGIR